jgi:hypothetical protein
MLRQKRLATVPTGPFDAETLAERMQRSPAPTSTGWSNRREAVLGEILDGAAERALRESDLAAAIDASLPARSTGCERPATSSSSAEPTPATGTSRKCAKAHRLS